MIAFLLGIQWMLVPFFLFWAYMGCIHGPWYTVPIRVALAIYNGRCYLINSGKML